MFKNQFFWEESLDLKHLPISMVEIFPHGWFQATTVTSLNVELGRDIHISSRKLLPLGLTCLFSLHASHETQGMGENWMSPPKSQKSTWLCSSIEVDNEGKRVVLAAGKGMWLCRLPAPPPHFQQNYLFIGDAWPQGPMLVVLQQLHSLSQTSLQRKEKRHWGAQIQGSCNSFPCKQ